LAGCAPSISMGLCDKPFDRVRPSCQADGRLLPRGGMGERGCGRAQLRGLSGERGIVESAGSYCATPAGAWPAAAVAGSARAGSGRGRRSPKPSASAPGAAGVPGSAGRGRARVPGDAAGLLRGGARMRPGESAPGAGSGRGRTAPGRPRRVRRAVASGCCGCAATTEIKPQRSDRRVFREGRMPRAPPWAGRARAWQRWFALAAARVTTTG